MFVYHLQFRKARAMSGITIEPSTFIEARATVVHFLYTSLEPSPGISKKHLVDLPCVAQACSTLDQYYAGFFAESDPRPTRLLDFYTQATHGIADSQVEAHYRLYQPRWPYRLAWDELADLFGFVETLAAEAVRIDQSGDLERALRVCAFQTILELGGLKRQLERLSEAAETSYPNSPYVPLTALACLVCTRSAKIVARLTTIPRELIPPVPAYTAAG